MRNSEDNWKRPFKSELVIQQHCHPVSNWVRSEKWYERSGAMQLQKILFILLLETLMNESGNEAPVWSQAFSQSWAETKKSGRHYLSYQLPVTLETILDSYTSWQVLRELHWAGYTHCFPAGPRRPLTGGCSFSLWPVTWRVPQGSILQPFLFNIYAKPSGNMMKYLGSNASHYIDDMQLYVSFSPSCWQHSPKPHSVESEGSIAGRGWSQKRVEWGWQEVGG